MVDIKGKLKGIGSKIKAKNIAYMQKKKEEREYYKKVKAEADIKRAEQKKQEKYAKLKALAERGGYTGIVGGHAKKYARKKFKEMAKPKTKRIARRVRRPRQPAVSVDFFRTTKKKRKRREDFQWF